MIYWDSVIPKGTIKLAVTVGEHPRVSTIMMEFLVIDCPSAFNGVIGRLFSKVLKVVTSIYHLTMKFPTTEGTGQVRGSHSTCGSAIISRLSWQRKKERKLPQMMEVGRVSVGPMETNINLRL